MPEWLIHLFRHDSKDFGHALIVAHRLDDWGLLAEIKRYHKLNGQLLKLYRQQYDLENTIEAALDNRWRSRVRLQLGAAEEKFYELSQVRGRKAAERLGRGRPTS